MNEPVVDRPSRASAWRRVAAYGIDSLVIVAYLMVLFLIGSRAEFVELSAWRAHLLGFLSLTLPVVTVFAGLEASSWRGTLGKRLMDLRVADAGGGPASFAFAYAVSVSWVASLWWGRTPYDGLAGLRVVPARHHVGTCRSK